MQQEDFYELKATVKVVQADIERINDNIKEINDDIKDINTDIKQLAENNHSNNNSGFFGLSDKSFKIVIFVFCS